MFKIIPFVLSFYLAFVAAGSAANVLPASAGVVPMKNYVATATPLYTIEGYILPPNRNLGLTNRWLSDITLAINGGEYKGFVRTDGHFLISGVPYGSHVVEVYHPDIYFRPVRVEINAKGRYRARAVSYVEPATIAPIAYPLRLPPVKRRKFFTEREQWRFVDFYTESHDPDYAGARPDAHDCAPHYTGSANEARAGKYAISQGAQQYAGSERYADIFAFGQATGGASPIPEKTSPKKICNSCGSKQKKKKR